MPPMANAQTTTDASTPAAVFCHQVGYIRTTGTKISQTTVARAMSPPMPTTR